MKYIIAALCLFVPAQAQEDQDDGIIVPESSKERPEHIGVRAHTNHRYRVSPSGGGTPSPTGYSPADIRAFYGITDSSGGHDIIAIVDAYHHPMALSDFNGFSQQFSLPVESNSAHPLDSANAHFQVVYQSKTKFRNTYKYGYTGTTPPTANTGWSQEEALDIEWAHAMAPNAKILLVEASSNSFLDLLDAVSFAASYNDGHGRSVKQLSMSWGGGEFTSESSYDYHFNNGGVVFFASTGDTGGLTEWPAVAPNVVAVGGTSITKNSNGDVVETGWSGSGGGFSSYEKTKPSYQNGVLNTGSSRSVPDISSDADPNTGVSVLWNGSWYVFGGTSVSSPCVAGMVNLASTAVQYPNGSADLLKNIYASLGTANFFDVISGTAGGNTCGAGWDAVTGVGAPRGSGGFLP